MQEDIRPAKTSRAVRKPDAKYGIHDHGTKWLVDIRRSGVAHAKMFAFSTHGGKAPALAHAQAWRDAILTQHPIKARKDIAQTLRTDNSSGVAGVVCGMNKDGRPRRCIALTHIAPGVILSKSFSTTKYGYDGAKALAIAERARQLEQMDGYVARILLHWLSWSVLPSRIPPSTCHPRLLFRTQMVSGRITTATVTRCPGALA